MRFTNEQKREYAINKKIIDDEVALKRLMEIDCYKYPINDMGFSMMFSNIYFDTCRYNITTKSWFVYNGKIWEEDICCVKAQYKMEQFYDMLPKFSIKIEDDIKKKNFLEFASKLGGFNKRETILKDAQNVNYISNNDLDKNTDLLNCQNGTLNLKTGEFKKHYGDDLLSKITIIYYEPGIISTDWIEFIDCIMKKDEEKTEYLQKILGYSLTTDASLETCFILYGETTRNGKSTLVETISRMLGNENGYALNMSAQTLAQKQNTDSRTASSDIVRLRGCRFLNVNEPHKKMILDSALLKTLIGRDSVTARQLFQREEQFIPCFKLFINTNHLPIITDDSLFSSKRINVITFDRHFKEEEQNKDLKNTLATQKNISGIFNWLLEGLRKFKIEGANPPDDVKISTREYREKSDKIGTFLNDCMEKTGKNSKISEVYVEFSKWCNDNGYGCDNKSNFIYDLKSKGFYKKRGSVDGITCDNIIPFYQLKNDNNISWLDKEKENKKKYWNKSWLHND